ncbi:hypothetical protein [Nocardiopsis sp. LOL_012]|uniref:hypothetical protein n=1 Tax=Nocardiopsis sp. LOL_012 TaxID=3345409 RepID=UPI003A87975B
MHPSPGQEPVQISARPIVIGADPRRRRRLPHALRFLRALLVLAALYQGLALVSTVVLLLDWYSSTPTLTTRAIVGSDFDAVRLWFWIVMYTPLVFLYAYAVERLTKGAGQRAVLVTLAVHAVLLAVDTAIMTAMEPPSGLLVTVLAWLIMTTMRLLIPGFFLLVLRLPSSKEAFRERAEHR